jgi:tetratricopeptide (TPR) repeat protein
MRQILVEHARARGATKRGGGGARLSLEEIATVADSRNSDLLDLDDALNRLAGMDARKGRMIELRHFGGLSVEEISALEGSPEQVEGGHITTATDVYATGAILYELLTGERAQVFQTFTPEEVRRVVCSDDAGARTRKRLGGDLDNVVRMAMRKEPQRRYASVEQLSTDICRYPDGLPVLAHKDSWRYRLGKLLVRNKLTVAAALLLVASLAAGMAATMRKARIAEQERNRAYSMLHFFQQVVGAADAESTFPVRLRADATLADLMDAAAQGLNSFTSDAMAEAVLRTTVGNAYRTMEKWDKAETQLNRAYAIQKGGAGPVEQRVRVLRALAQLAFRKGDLQRAKEMDLEALRIWDGMGAAADQKAKLGALNEIGTIFLQIDQPKEALPFLLRAQEIVRANPGMDPAWVVSATGALARAWGNLGEREKAEPLYREAIARGEKMGWPPPNSLSTHMHNLAILIRATNPEDAENWLRRAVELKTKLYGAENSNTLSSGVELELTRARLGKVAEAEVALRKALGVERRTLPAGHYETQRTLRALGETLRLGGKYQEAEAVLRESLQARLKIYGADSAIVAETQAELPMAVAGLERKPEAKTMLEQALAVLSRRFPAGHPSRAAVEEKLRKIAGE